MVDPADLLTDLILILGLLSDFSGYHLQGVSVFNENVCFSTCSFVCLKNRSANVRGYCFFSIGAEFGLCLSIVLHLFRMLQVDFTLN